MRYTKMTDFSRFKFDVFQIVLFFLTFCVTFYMQNSKELIFVELVLLLQTFFFHILCKLL